MRGRFYGKKNYGAGTYGFIAVVLGGLLLSLGNKTNIWVAYGFLFAGAMIAKLISLWHILTIEEKKEKKESANTTFKYFLQHIHTTSFGKYVFYMCCMSVAVYIAAPFFTPYMLLPEEQGGLGFNYLQFTILNGVATIAGFSILKHWGNITDRFGNRRVLVFAGFLIPFVPLLWIFSTNFFYLLFIEIISGTIWAGFNIATANYVFDIVGQRMRMIYGAYYNGLTMLASFIGALLGSGLYAIVASLHLHGIIFLFFASFVLRFIVTLLFLTRLRELREVEGYAFFHELSVKPIQGFIHGAVQSMRSSYFCFRKKHIVDLVKLQKRLLPDDEFYVSHKNKYSNSTKRKRP